MTRRRRRRTFVLLLVLASLAGVAWLRWRGMPRAAMRALTDADQYELLSLQPYMGTITSPEAPRFYDHEIIGRTLISDPAVRAKLNDALERGVREIEDPNRVRACFNPRHGIRVTRAGLVTDFVICFECRQIHVWRGDTLIASIPTSSSPQSVFDEVFQRAGVPLAPKAP